MSAVNVYTLTDDELNGLQLECLAEMQRRAGAAAYIADVMPDAQKVLVPPADEDVPEWHPPQIPADYYKALARVHYLGIIYESLITENEFSPADRVDLWRPLRPAPASGGPAIYQDPPTPAAAYAVGDKVQWNGYTYVSLVDGNMWSPSSYVEGWEREQ